MKRLALCALLAACGFNGHDVSSDGPDVTPPDGEPDAPPTPVPWRSVAGGIYHSCGIRADDSLWCWGENGTGQLGIGGAPIESGTPVRVGTARWTKVTTALATTCGIQTDGTLWCWGSNADGIAAADPAVDGRFDAPRSLGPETYVDVAVGISHACAIRTGGALLCWGANNVGQLGNNTVVTTFVPVTVPGVWRKVTAGLGMTCAIDSDELLWCWGLNNAGQLGIGSMSDDMPALVPTVVPGATWREVSAMWASTCGLRTDGHVLCWGYGAYGTLGTNKVMSEASPTETYLDDDQWKAVSVGAFAACGVRADDSLWCWGNDQLGTIALDPPGASVNVTPKPTGALLGPVAALGAPLGFSHSCVITADGAAACSGFNGAGTLGDGTGGSEIVPVQVPGTWLAIAAGTSTTCAVPETGNVECWGHNETGTYGAGDTEPSPVPRPTLYTNPVSIAVGRYFTCVARDNGDVHCAGYNEQNQLGSAGASKASPTKVGSLSVRSVVSGGHSCALPRMAATVGIACWGPNNAGQLGVGDTTARASPAIVLQSRAAISVAVGAAHTCAVQDDNTLHCVGSNAYGQLGDGGTTTRSTFAQVLGVYTQVFAGGDHTCALDSAGALACWGRNDNGELGIGTTTNALMPQPIAGTWKTASLGISHTCAVRGDDTLWCWGRNARGSLGDGTTTLQMTPVQVGTDADWANVAAGNDFTCALKTNNTLWCWGTNVSGQIGDGEAWRFAWDAVAE